jgi:hypothetical protein
MTVIGLTLLSVLYTRDLIALTNGLSTAETKIAETPVGWQGILNDSFYLPLKLLLSAGFYLFDQGGALVSRLPSVLFAMTAVFALTAVIKAWHGTRIALFAGAMFATSAWTLHVSRYAGLDSSYLLAAPVLIATVMLLKRSKCWWIPAFVLFIWSVLLFTPGLIWLILLAAFWERYSIVDAWNQSTSWLKKLLLPFSFILLLPLLIYRIASSTDATLTWLGLASNFGNLSEFAVRLGSVPLNLFAMGPNNPELWLGRLPLLDTITIVFTILGIVYYAKRWRADRSRLLGSFLIISWFIIALGGPAGLSLIVPIIYFLAGSGIAQLNNEWLKRFPNNPIARSFGTILLVLAIAMSCLYNLRSYFIAWPNNPATISTFTDR